MSRRQRSRGGPVEVVKLLGVVGLDRRRGLRAAVVRQDDVEAIELRTVSLAPTAAVAPRSHRSVIPLGALDAVVALLASYQKGGQS